jgi:hypothetical protein
MPAKKTAAKTDETPDIEQAGLDELAQISMKAACDITRGIIRPKEGNAISRRVGKRLETLEQERRSHRAA